MRALAYSLKGHYDTAIRDYDSAIAMRPDFAVALNNRAWAYFRWGRASTGPGRRRKARCSSARPARTRSILAPTSARRSATRKAPLNDYDKAMWHGGARMIKLYQCGLTEAAALYRGRSTARGGRS